MFVAIHLQHVFSKKYVRRKYSPQGFRCWTGWCLVMSKWSKKWPCSLLNDEQSLGETGRFHDVQPLQALPLWLHWDTAVFEKSHCNIRNRYPNVLFLSIWLLKVHIVHLFGWKYDILSRIPLVCFLFNICVSYKSLNALSNIIKQPVLFSST